MRPVYALSTANIVHLSLYLSQVSSHQDAALYRTSIALVFMFFSWQACARDQIIVVTEHLPPLQIETKHMLTGFAVDQFRLALAHQGLALEIQVLPWSRAYKLALHMPNVLIFSIDRHKQREPLFQWIGPVFAGHSGDDRIRTRTAEVKLWQLANGQIKIPHVDAIKQHTLCVPRSDALKMLLIHNVELSEENLVQSAGWKQSLKMFMAGRCELFAYSRRFIGTLLTSSRFSQNSIEQVFNLQPYLNQVTSYYAFSMGTPQQRVDAFRSALSQVQNSSQYQQLVERWVIKLRSPAHKP